MTVPQSSKFHEFLEYVNIDVKKINDPELELVIRYLENQIDGISKLKVVLEISLSIGDFMNLGNWSKDVIQKFGTYKIWLIKHQMIIIAEAAGLDHTPAHADETLQNPQFAEAAAMFQSEDWQKRIWGKWAYPPYE